MKHLFGLSDPRRSVRGKLGAAVMLTAIVVLVTSGAAMLIHDLSVYRRSWAADIGTEANLLALTVGPALAFDDRATARRNLEALRSRPAVLAAVLFAADGSLYASYVREGRAVRLPEAPPAVDGVKIDGSRVQVSQPVEFNNEYLGRLYVQARYDVAGRVWAYLGIFSVIALVSLVAALLLSAVLQRLLTAPIEAIGAVALRIIREKDYSLRVHPTGRDEIGVVVQALNRMLGEIEQRTRAMELTNETLRQEMQERQQAETRRRETEGVYRAIGESIDYGVWITDAQGRLTYVSESFLRLLGQTQEQVSNMGWASALHPDDRDATIAAWVDTVRGGDSWYREHRILGVDGKYHAVLAQGVPIRGDDGHIIGWAGINLDIGRLKETEEALREADRRKDEFLATLAHELRNPLAPIRHATLILESPVASPEQRQWGRAVIARQVQHMALLLDDLLDVSRITRGRLELKREVVSIESLINAALETARPLIESRQHQLTLDVPKEPVLLDVDPLRVSQALSNLLTNAAKYTDPGGSIEVGVRRDAGGLGISVRDTGIGLSAAAIPRVFEMFSQMESALERSQGGLGIGLALVRGLIALHGGTVSAHSEGQGKGSTFTIHLPASTLVSRAAG
jgi:PAS domain S-box-containing protein